MNVFCKMQRPFAVAAEGLGTSEAPEPPKHPKLFFAVLCVRGTASKYLLPFAYGNAVKTSSLL